MDEHERFEQEANYYVPTQEHSQYILSALAYSDGLSATYIFLSFSLWCQPPHESGVQYNALLYVTCYTATSPRQVTAVA